jgi:tellurite resistance protein TerC
VPFEWGAFLIILQLIYLEGILSIDNAAVLGAMVSNLPPDDPIPWPRALRFLQRPVHRLLGGQRLAALKVGLLGAYLGRGSMLFVAAWVVRNQWLLLLGGLYLIYLAVSHFSAQAEQHGAGDGGHHIRAGLGFWAVVVNVELADLAFSLDNVVAAVALSRDMWVVLAGVFLGIVTMRFAAGIFVKLIERAPVLEAAAYLLVLAIGLELLAEELLGLHLSRGMKFAVSLGILGGTLAYGKILLLQQIGAHMRWIPQGLAVLIHTVRLVLWPVGWALRSGARGVGCIVAAVSGRQGMTGIGPR